MHDAVLNLHLNNSQLTSEVNELLSNDGSSTTHITAANGSLIKGNAVNAVNGLATIYLDNSVWQGNATEISTVSVKNGGQGITNTSSTVGSLQLDNGSLIFYSISS